jgi:hypothetical protein
MRTDRWDDSGRRNMVKPHAIHPEMDEPGTESAAGRKPSVQALIAAPPSVDTTVIREELSRRGIHGYQIDEVASAGRSLTDVLEESVRRADLVVAVLGNGGRDNVLLELGFALALKKRALVIVPPGEMPPVESVPYLRTRPDNREAIDFGLSQILAAPQPPRTAREAAAPSTKPLGQLTDDLLRRLDAAGAHPDVQELAQLIHDALTASGISVMNRSVPRSSAAAGWADFAVWSDDFEPWIGNPLLIEVRAGMADLDQALSSVSRLLEERGRGTAWGLLLCCCPEIGLNGKSVRESRIFVMPIRQFLTSLRDTSLGELVKELRNQRVHGRDEHAGLFPQADQADPAGR